MVLTGNYLSDAVSFLWDEHSNLVQCITPSSYTNSHNLDETAVDRHRASQRFLEIREFLVGEQGADLRLAAYVTMHIQWRITR